jgi:hypothetical protein
VTDTWTGYRRSRGDACLACETEVDGLLEENMGTVVENALDASLSVTSIVQRPAVVRILHTSIKPQLHLAQQSFTQ